MCIRYMLYKVMYVYIRSESIMSNTNVWKEKYLLHWMFLSNELSEFELYECMVHNQLHTLHSLNSVHETVQIMESVKVQNGYIMSFVELYEYM